MSTEGIISIAITLVLGIPSLITLFKINQTKIVYLEKQLINLKDDLLKNFDDLSIKYKGVEVQKNIFFISGFIICHGKKDISNEKNTINITIPENSKWLDYKIVDKSKGMKIKKDINKNEVSLNFDLFKSKEFFEYEGIVEINEDVDKLNLKKIIEFHHRIPNIPTINKFNIETLKSSFFILIISIILLILPLQIAYYYNDINTYDITAYNSETNKKLDYSAIYSYKNIRSLKEKIVEERSGFILLFEGKTEDFPVDIDDKYGEKDTKSTSVYFKMNDLGASSWMYFSFLFLLFIVSMTGVVYSITLFFYKKRYLKFIDK
ncbi:hypothetical protein [Winogradskyella haliclonae]|uniref:Uncharacterized protein n=1 Tax=Winogradskyella haliclonae TaxID=2048558 RepID=A0ABQ2BWW7_9FLAO|nr:hypothetical protein [Winogradskyella haliclonae]GGI56356.1 hypothetical protein GCM10011444_06650 [Winogradskyella haliclonae]